MEENKKVKCHCKSKIDCYCLVVSNYAKSVLFKYMPTKKYQIQKNEVAFLSANTWDVSGAGNYGYNSIWVNRNNNIFDNLDYEPKLEIKMILEKNTLKNYLIRVRH